MRVRVALATPSALMLPVDTARSDLEADAGPATNATAELVLLTGLRRVIVLLSAFRDLIEQLDEPCESVTVHEV